MVCEEPFQEKIAMKPKNCEVDQVVFGQQWSGEVANLTKTRNNFSKETPASGFITDTMRAYS